VFPEGNKRRKALAFAKRIQELREDRGFSLAHLGELCGLSRGTIWKIERGALPRGETLHALATTGLGLGPNSNDYRDLVALWTESRVSHGVGSVDTFTDRRMSARGQLRKEALEIYRKIQRLTPAQAESIRAALDDQRLLDLLVAALALRAP
jgi:transcriptional regulator with XRE-family HTH domain